jgi:acyl carrier protein phosphodiesterase
VNYLAHILLSGDNLDTQVGGLLGDFVKGPLQGQYPESVEKGIALHRRLDVYTDAQPEVQQLIRTFSPQWRRFAGIILDIAFDHVLTTRWQQYHALSLDHFCQRFYRHLDTCQAWLPTRAQHFNQRAAEIRWLQSYADKALIPIMLNRVGERLRRPVPLGDAWPEIVDRHGEVEQVFSVIMPRLQSRAQQLRLAPLTPTAPTLAKRNCR